MGKIYNVWQVIKSETIYDCDDDDDEEEDNDNDDL